MFGTRLEMLVRAETGKSVAELVRTKVKGLGEGESFGGNEDVFETDGGFGGVGGSEVDTP